HVTCGLIYIVPQFKPTFREASRLDDTDMVAAVTALNRQITELAPVLKSVTIRDAATVQSENAEVPVALMVKQHENSTYLFAVGCATARRWRHSKFAKGAEGWLKCLTRTG